MSTRSWLILRRVLGSMAVPFSVLALLSGSLDHIVGFSGLWQMGMFSLALSVLCWLCRLEADADL